MTIKTKICYIEVEVILILLILTSLISNTLLKFLYYFFACYLFILFHELMHILVGTILNKKLIKIKLSISGVCAIFEKDKFLESRKIYFKNIIIYLAGPVSNIMLAYLFKNNTMIREINIFLAILNLLPIFPLDGYNILLNALKFIFNKEKSKIILNKFGIIFVVLLTVLGIYQIIEFNNFSMIIFCIYLYVLKLNKTSKSI